MIYCLNQLPAFVTPLPHLVTYDGELQRLLYHFLRTDTEVGLFITKNIEVANPKYQEILDAVAESMGAFDTVGLVVDQFDYNQYERDFLVNGFSQEVLAPKADESLTQGAHNAFLINRVGAEKLLRLPGEPNWNTALRANTDFGLLFPHVFSL